MDRQNARPIIFQPPGNGDQVRLELCPFKYVTPDVWTFFDFARIADDGGHLPLAGGSLDQTQSFLDAYAFRAGEKSHWMNAD